MGEEVKPAGKRIVIPYRELHPHLKEEVNVLLNEREKRLYGETPGHLLYLGTAGAASGVIGSLVKTGFFGSFEPQSNEKLIPWAIGGAVVFPTIFYKHRSQIVRRRTAAIASELKQLTHFDNAGQHHIGTLKETHPFGFFNRKGDLVLVPNTRFQRALKKAQQTFLRHIVPGRFRFRLSNKETPNPPEASPTQRSGPFKLRAIPGGKR